MHDVNDLLRENGTDAVRDWIDGSRKKFESIAPTPSCDPLVREAEKAAPFPLAALGPLRDAVEGVADLVQVPPALAAQSVLATAALATQGHADVETPGGGRAPLSLFLLTIALSGERKSGADRLSKRGVVRHEDRLRRKYTDQFQAWRSRLSVWEERERAIKKSAAADPTMAQDELEALGPPPAAPLQPCVHTGAPTIEGLIKNAAVLSPSFAIDSDEGGAFLGGHSMKSENRMATVSELSSMWDGRVTVRVRAGDGVSIQAGRRLAVHLMVQPIVAASLLADDLAAGQGLLARFLVTAPETAQGRRDWRHVPSLSAEAAVEAFADAVFELLGRPLPLKDNTGELDPPLVQLSADARKALVDAGNAIELELKPGGAWESVRATANKTIEQACRIAGVLTVFEDPTAQAVSEKTFRDALDLALYYLGEARRLIGVAAVDREMADAETLRRWLVEKWDEDHVSTVEVTKYGPNGIRDTKRARTLLGILAKDGCIVREGKVVEIRSKRRREAYRVLR